MKYTEHSFNGEFRTYKNEKGGQFDPAPPGDNVEYDQMVLDIAADPSCLIQVDDTPVPTVDELRIAAYGSIGDQLDEIYHDVDAWRVRIKEVKRVNPK
jgi:hypothetical protein